MHIVGRLAHPLALGQVRGRGRINTQMVMKFRENNLCRKGGLYAPLKGRKLDIHGGNEESQWLKENSVVV